MKTTKDDKKPRKPFFNVRGWTGWNEIESGGRVIKSLAMKFLVPVQATRIESFEEALERFQLSEADIAERIKNFKRLLMVFLMGTASLLGYAFFLLFIEHAPAAALASFGLTAVLLAQVFRYHFWLFQMKQRKLGCSFKEWLRYCLIGPNKTDDNKEKGMVQK